RRHPAIPITSLTSLYEPDIQQAQCQFVFIDIQRVKLRFLLTRATICQLQARSCFYRNFLLLGLVSLLRYWLPTQRFF
ncbi:hypothetical protein, partial [Vibrio fluvialis]|uniref:hypothetical protein n=1 Tax=Vibrio fluvialis TaxID=676 RepID=UPI001EE9E76C